mgnify:CR=1 FL=1
MENTEKDNGTITYSTTVNGEDSENYGNFY